MSRAERLTVAGLLLGVLFATTAGATNAVGKRNALNGLSMNGAAEDDLPDDGAKPQHKSLRDSNRQDAGKDGVASHPLGGLLSLDTAPVTRH